MAAHDYTIKVEGGKRYLIIDFKGSEYGPSVADFPAAMQEVIEKLSKTDADVVVLADVYERIYDEAQTTMLKEISDLADLFRREGVWGPSRLGTAETATLSSRHDLVVLIAQDQLKTDPIHAYLTLVNAVRAEKERSAVSGNTEFLKTLAFMLSAFEKVQMVKRLKAIIAKLGGKIPGGRDIYHSLFEVQIKPAFVSSRVFFHTPADIELVDQYEVADSLVSIYKHPEQVQYLYYVNPPEYNLTPEKYFLLSKTREIVSAYRPEGLHFMSPQDLRNYFSKLYETTISDLAAQNNIPLTGDEKKKLANIVTRYTVGYGMMELILSDRRLTDVYMDAPLGSKPVYVVHSEYGTCQTNVVFTDEEAKGIISRFRGQSGRPFDEAHPVLDLDLDDLQTRVAVIGPPLSPDGTAFALRLHKTTPWTLQQMVDNKMLNSLAAGMLSFFIDAQASTLVNGSRGSGKTSLLTALMLEILPSARILVQEDSVTGDSGIIVEKNGEMLRTTVGELVDGLFNDHGCVNVDGREILFSNNDNVKVFSLDKQNKVKLSAVSQFMRHKVSKDIYSIRTSSGRNIKVTGDHSLFGLSSGKVCPVKTSDFLEGDYIAIPRILPAPDKSFVGINILDKFSEGYVESDSLKILLSENKEKVRKIAKEKGYSKSAPNAWIRKGLLPISIYKEHFRGKISEDQLLYRDCKDTKSIPSFFHFDEDFLEFCGLWLADGCYDSKYGVIVSVVEEELREKVRKIAARMGLNARMHSDGFSLIISNTAFVKSMREAIELDGNSYTKKMPQWAFNLSKSQTAAILRGLYSGDGHASKSEVVISLCSDQLLKDTSHLLLTLGVVSRKGKKRQKDHVTPMRVGSAKMCRFFSKVGFLVDKKTQRLESLCSRNPNQDVKDIIPLSLEEKKELSAKIPAFSSYDYISRGNCVGREKFRQFASMMSVNGTVLETIQNPTLIAESDVFWDEIVEIRNLGKTGEFVYDFSVPECESFVCEEIIAHNTLEVPVPALKALGYNVQRMKTQSAIAISRTSAEVPPEEALRTALRLGDSVLIVGEVRSGEAKVLYEAMRVGAVGNVVMGTIHGENAYSVWDRIVNDLGVPNTSFKATDIVVTAAPVRFRGSLKRQRRLIEITEIGKHWYTDPEREGGLIEILKFDAEKDCQYINEEALKKSELFPRIAEKRGLKVEDLWKDIYARADCKQFQVDMKRKYNIPDLLEGRYTVPANDKWLLILENQRTDNSGRVDYETAKKQWKEWVTEEQVKALLARRQQIETLKKRQGTGE